jgi:tetratricopeptide (TPR) repeat protein
MATIAEAMAIAFNYHQRGDLAQAEKIYRQVVEAEPEHADAWHLLGVAAQQTGRPTEAATAIARAVAINGSNPTYYNHLGAAYASAGETDLAETALRRALALDPGSAQTHYNLAALLNQVGKPTEAIASYRKAVQLSPDFAEAHFNLGNIYRDLDQLAEAEQSYKAAMAARPGYFKAAMNLANVQLKRDEQPSAEASFRQALQIDPAHAEAHYWLGSLLQSQGRLSEALAELQAAVFHNPRAFEAQNNLGCVFRALDQLDSAEQCFRMALLERPESAEALNNLGSVLHDRKEFDAAAECFQLAIERNGAFVQAHNNLGSVRQDQKRFDEALEHFRRAEQLDPNSADTLVNIGGALHMLGKPEQAVEYHRRAIAIDPNLSRAHYSLAAALHTQHLDDEAELSYGEAIRLKPDYPEAYYNRSFVHLSRGEFAAGWKDYEWRFRCKDYKGRRFDAPRWDGSPLAGRKLLVHAEQGLGDTLHFIRYVRQLDERGGNVVVEVQPALVPLLRASGFTSVIPGGSPLPRFDVHVSMLSLPGVMGTTVETIPAPVPYLAAEPRLLKTWRNRLRAYSGFKVGLIWQGNAAYTFDHFRSIPLVAFAPLAEIEGVQLISLQKNAGVEQLAALEGRFTAIDLGSTLDTDAGAFMDTAAVMCNLDLVVTSDTAAAHLAGGLGVPVWLGLSAAPEWRWMQNRGDSPWYPSMRLFRQSTTGDWSKVFAEMKTELQELVAKRSPNF